MDDFNAAVLYEAKNEYASRLVNILTPLIIQGFKAIFKEAWNLCIKNEEDAKYLMTFQNFLTRVPKWNQEIINVETKRILDSSKCLYLEDLLTCVHITQLKILTSIRVSSKQKKIDIDIPKLHDYIHKVYISAARKLYQNVYLFEENILPLSKQKNMRECEIIIRESILNVIRENMPIEKILRAYIDETIEEEIVEEVEEVPVDDPPLKKEDVPPPTEDGTNTEGLLSGETEKFTIKKKEDVSTDIVKSEPILALTDSPSVINTPLPPINEVVESKPALLIENKKLVNTAPMISPPKISFNNNDNVVEYSTKDNAKTIAVTSPEIISAPKTIARLERISTERNEQRKLEEEEEEDEDDYGMDSLKISDKPIDLGALDIHDISTGLSLNNKPELTGVEVLA